MTLERDDSRLVCRRVNGVEIRIQRCFYIHDQISAIRHVHNHVGANCSVIGAARVHLFAEVAVIDHARELDDAAQLHFAPLAPDVGGTEWARQAFGCGLPERYVDAMARAVVMRAPCWRMRREVAPPESRDERRRGRGRSDGSCMPGWASAPTRSLSHGPKEITASTLTARG